MPSTRDLLQRFRPAGAPGAATATGVPVDRVDERAAELAGVFALLEETVSQAERVCVAAATQAREGRDRVHVRALATVAQARLDAEAVRTQTVAEARDAIAAARRHSSIEAELRGQEIEREASRTRDRDVIRVVAAVRELVVGPDPGGSSS